MLKQALFLLLLVLFVLWQPAGAQDSLRSGDSTRVIYQIRGRIYIDRGSLDGLDDSWQIAIPAKNGKPVFLPLTWVGEDIAWFQIPDSIGYNLPIPKVLSLNRPMGNTNAGYKITLAYPHIPAMPNEGSVDYYDREFQSLISPLLQIRPLNQRGDSPDSNLKGGNSDSSKDESIIYNFYHAGDNYCESDPVGLPDARYTLQYYRSHLVPEAYSIKYLPDPDNPLNIYWDTIINACMPSEASEEEFEGIFKSARFSILKPTPESSEDDPYSMLGNSDQPAISQPYYGSSYGPYYISEKSNDQIMLLRNRGCPTSQVLPDTIVIKIEPDYLKRKLMFQLGQSDFLDLQFSDVDQFENSYKVKQAELNEAAYLTMNNLKPLLSDGIMATALSYLINKDGLCRVALGKSALPMDNLMAKWNREILPMYKYDKNKGQSLIRNMNTAPRYLSLYICPDDFLNRRTAEYIKGILERENIYVTIYSEIKRGEGRPYDLFQQFDMMIGRIDLSVEDPIYILNQTAFHYDLDNIAGNMSLYYSQNIDSIMSQCLANPEINQNLLKEYYRSLMEIPAGVPLFRPIRQVAGSEKIKNFAMTKDGFIDFSTIEIENETQR